MAEERAGVRAHKEADFRRGRSSRLQIERKEFFSGSASFKAVWTPFQIAKAEGRT